MENNRDVQASQKECLNQFFSVVKNWNECRIKQEDELIAIEDGLKESIINIGYLSLPKFLDDLLEVVLVHEIAIPFQTENQNSINSWRMMIRHASSFIEANEKENVITDHGIADMYNPKRDEKFEIALFDAPNRFEKKIDALKKVRKVYAKEPIIVKVFVENPLMADVEISKIFLK